MIGRNSDHHRAGFSLPNESVFTVTCLDSVCVGVVPIAANSFFSWMVEWTWSWSWMVQRCLHAAGNAELFTLHTSQAVPVAFWITHTPAATRELYCTSGVWRDPSSCEDESWVRMRLVYAKIWLLCFYCNAIYHFGYWDRNIQAVVLHNCLTIVELARFL